jgi:hypothetical protein
MSYDVSLDCACCGKSMDVPRHEEGGTYLEGGNTQAELNITYNYSLYYYKHLDAEQGLRWLYGKTGAACIDRLRAAGLAILEDEELERAEMAQIEARRRTAAANPPPQPTAGDDATGTLTLFALTLHRSALAGPQGYWAPTRANAAAPLATLLRWAELHPGAVFSGD